MNRKLHNHFEKSLFLTKDIIIFEKDIQQFLRIQSGPEGVHTLSFELLHTKSCQLYQKWRGSAICTIDEIAPQQKQYPITAGTYCLMITLDAPYPKNLQLSFVLQSSAEELVMVEDIHSKEPVPVHSLPVNPSSKVSLEKSPLKPSSAAPADSSTEAQLQELTLLNESLEQLQQLVGALEERSLRVSQDQEMIQQKVETLLQSLGDHTNT